MKTVVLTFYLLLTFSIANAEDEKLVPIHAFRRETAPEMVYTIDSEEITRLKRTNGWEDRGVLGYGSPKDGKGLIKLQRAHRGRWHVFYTKAPEQLPKGTELEEFDVWVWEKPDEGLSPIYAASLPDWRDMIFSTDKDQIKQAIEDSWNASKVKRTDHGVMFYLKPMKKDE
ncbi:MAG: hypothetical protein P8M30_11705 [Planctomycetaceae bacterium]|jgi:hypothetical protein|nr:hypothetical protein [Planctomycetaceae bacterium]MDC0273935.1 hypothetical protein [Planctomycetaceae bacterium]MDG2389975.1 hypothetical protein [Planctomycetaceae bacterium]